MYQYFLGSFGNKRFIRPQYEIIDGQLREIEDRFQEFPEGGTVSVSDFNDDDLDDIKNRLFKFRIDIKKDLSPHYQPSVANSNKYLIKLQNVEELNSDELIEILEIDCSIEEFLNDKSKRTLRIKHKPNKQILLRNTEGCFGPFEFMIADVEEVPYSDEAIYTLKININSGIINIYGNADLDKYIHEATTRCVSVYYREIIDRLQGIQERIFQLYNRYCSIMECKPEAVYGVPKLTNTFKRVHPYRLVFEVINQWYSSGDYAFEHLNYLFKLKTLSRIFEYYCLIKLALVITRCGFQLDSSDRIVYDSEEDYEDINNKYVFSKAHMGLELFYEPSIWTDKNNEVTNLYSTGYNFSKSRWNNKWTPDFVLKLICGNDEYYFILDAKYSKEENVRKLYMPELVLKYSTQIASLDKNYSDVMGIGAIFPDEEDKYMSFKRNYIGSSKESLPRYFSVSVGYDEEGTVNLGKHIRKLIALVEKFDEDRYSEVGSSKEINRESDLVLTEKGERRIFEDELIRLTNIKEKEAAILDSIASEKIDENIIDTSISMESNKDIVARSVPIQDKVINEVTEKQEKKNNKNKELSSKANQMITNKNCLYYGKAFCMIQKKLCSKERCELFIPKQGRRLENKENGCRNLERYIRRGHIFKVECKISGLPGCIGTDKCVRFLKKKNYNG